MSALDMFVINLDRTPERMRQFQQVNSHLARVTRFQAVDGKTVGRTALLQTFAEPFFYTDGAVGNALSHLGLWDVAAARSSYTTVFEDDAIVHKDFAALAPEMIAELSSDWDVVLWGWIFDDLLSFDIFPGVPCLSRFSETDLLKQWETIQKDTIRRPALYRLHFGFGTVAYSISPTGAKKLAALAVPIQPFLYKLPGHNFQVQNTSLDCLLTTLYDRLHAYVCVPPLVLTTNDQSTSTVTEVFGGRLFGRLRRVKQSLLGVAPAPPPAPLDESGFRLIPSPDYPKSREYTLGYARYLDKNGDMFGAARKYLKQRFMRD